MNNSADGFNVRILIGGTDAMIHALLKGGTIDGAETIGGMEGEELPGDMSGTLASASGSLTATLATIGVTIGAMTLAPKEPDVSGTRASANGSQKFGTPIAADGRENATLALTLADQEEEQELQIQEEDLDADEVPKADSSWQATSILSS